MAIEVKKARFSEEIRKDSKGPEIDRLEAGGYVSPQGVPFKCGTCEFFVEGTGRVLSVFAPLGSGVSRCEHPKIKAPAEYDGCCDYWSHDGVSNPGT